MSEVAEKPLLDLYRALIASRLQPASDTDMARYLKYPPFEVSRKYDGELWYLVAAGKASKLVAANGRTLESDHPILNAAASCPEGTIYAGELYLPNNEGRERVGDVASALAKKGEGLTFAAFDVVKSGDTSFESINRAERFEILSQLPSDGVLHHVGHQKVTTVPEVESFFKESVTARGAEGLVVHCGDGRVVKVKAEKVLDLVVLGFTETEDSNVRSLILGVTTESGTVLLGATSNVDKAIAEKLSDLRALVVPSEFSHAASTGQRYQMIRPEVIVETRVVDLQIADSKGIAIKQPSLTFDGSQWRSGPLLPALSLINAHALRVRTDKSIDSDGASWRQIQTYLPDVAPTPTTELPKAKIIRRQVWTKGSGEKVDVRKLVVWQTNKESIDPLYPAFVVHWTDYSKGRKSPLDREAKPAPTEKIALQMADQMVEENIKKGWTEVTS